MSDAGWLIERVWDGSPMWLVISGSKPWWVPHTDVATRFSRECDAKDVAGFLFQQQQITDAWKVTEHQWG